MKGAADLLRSHAPAAWLERLSGFLHPPEGHCPELVPKRATHSAQQRAWGSSLHYTKPQVCNLHVSSCCYQKLSPGRLSKPSDSLESQCWFIAVLGAWGIFSPNTHTKLLEGTHYIQLGTCTFLGHHIFIFLRTQDWLQVSHF